MFCTATNILQGYVPRPHKKISVDAAVAAVVPEPDGFYHTFLDGLFGRTAAHQWAATHSPLKPQALATWLSKQ